jgi:hypothetical protein
MVRAKPNGFGRAATQPIGLPGSGEVALIRDTTSHYSPVLIAPFVNLGRRRDGAEIFFWTADGAPCANSGHSKPLFARESQHSRSPRVPKALFSADFASSQLRNPSLAISRADCATSIS